jgi:hypothetical protein
MAQAGDLAGALVLIDEVIAQIERPGWEERHYYAEALRIKAWLLTLKGDAEGAERAYIATTAPLAAIASAHRFRPCSPGRLKAATSIRIRAHIRCARSRTDRGSASYQMTSSPRSGTRSMNPTICRIWTCPSAATMPRF